MGSATLLFGIYIVSGYFINISSGIVIGNVREECRAHYPKDACQIGIDLEDYVQGCKEDYKNYWHFDLPILTFKFFGEDKTIEFTVKQPETNTSWSRSVMAYAFIKEKLKHLGVQGRFNILCTIDTVNVRENPTLTCRGSSSGFLTGKRKRRFVWYGNLMEMSIETQNDGITVCEEPYRYKQRISYSCPYNADATVTTKFKFMSTAVCGPNTTTEITVKVTGKNHNGSTALTEASTLPGKMPNASTDMDQRHKEKLFKVKDDLSITCEDVTGSVGEELTLTCRISYWNDTCCITKYKFIQTASIDSSTICEKEISSYFGLQFTSIFCSYTAKTAMTTKFKFFLQTNCGVKTSEITVNVTDSLDKENVRQGELFVLKETSTVSGKTSNASTDINQRHGDELFEVKVAAGCVLPLIVFAAIMGVIVWMKSSQVKRLLRGYLRGRTTDSDPVSDQQMQRYPSSESMERPITF